MKVLINDWPEPLNKEFQELPADTKVEFLTDGGDKFEVTASENHDGIKVRLVRELGKDEMYITPQFSNQIKIH